MNRRLIAALCLAHAVAGCSATAPDGASTNSPPADRERFAEVAQQAGLHSFVHTDGGSGKKYFVEQMGSGIAVLDYDGDGLRDIYFCSGAPLPGYRGGHTGSRLFRNLGGMRFEDVTEAADAGVDAYCIGAAVADYDGDGDDDLYLTCFGPNLLLRNDGGRFVDVTQQSGTGDPRLSSSAAWGDYDGDGDLDLYVANYVKYRLEDDLWCSKFKGLKSYCGPTLYDPEVDSLYRNEGGGRFTDVSVTSGIRRAAGNGLGVIWLDVDRNGSPEIFVANDQSPNFLWLNEEGKFREGAAEWNVAYGEEGNARAGMGVDSADFDNDGDFDLVITNFSEESNSLYTAEGNLFRDVAFAAGIGPRTLMYLGFGTAFLDYDRDGLQDLFFANGHVLDDIAKYSDAVTWEQPCQLFRNQGGGSFEEVSGPSGVAETRQVARGAALADLDNDGRTDILVSALRGKPLLFRNLSTPAAHWLGVELRGAGANTRGLGALVTLRGARGVQSRVVRTNMSYASSSDNRLLFGLGNEKQALELQVEWPSGEKSVVKKPPVDRYLTIDERPR